MPLWTQVGYIQCAVRCKLFSSLHMIFSALALRQAKPRLRRRALPSANRSHERSITIPTLLPCAKANAGTTRGWAAGKSLVWSTR
jgi:hypothetical protein